MRLLTDRIRTYKLFGADIRSNASKIAYITITDIVLFLIGMIPPVLYKILVDDIMLLGKIEKLKWLISAYLLVFILDTCVSACSLKLKKSIENKLKITYRIKILRKYLGKSMEEYEKVNVGDWKIRIDDDTNILSSFFMSQIIEYVLFGLQCIICMIVLLYINWKMSVIAIFMVPITLYFSHFIGTGQKKVSQKLWENNSSCNAWVQNTLKNWKEVKALGIESTQADQYQKYVDDECKAKVKWMKYFISNTLLRRFKNNFVLNVFMYFGGGVFIIKGFLSVGGLVLIMKYYSKLFGSIDKFNDCSISFKANYPALNRIFEIVKTEKKEESKKIRPLLRGDICFKGVSFSYADTSKEVILKDFDLTVRAGESVAVMGESGIGKSTLLKLLLGIVKPQTGSITIGGYNIDEIDPYYVYKSIGVVMQENVFMNLSIRENLLLANSKAKEDEIIAACDKACITDFIDSLPEGYNTIIGENGVKLSGGQKQRLALARVFLSHSDILILDEPTSSLDKITEQKIWQSIQELCYDKTIIVITHNASILQFTNRIVRMEST